MRSVFPRIGLIGLLAMLLALAGCGQKGLLYIQNTPTDVPRPASQAPNTPEKPTPSATPTPSPTNAS